MLLNCFCRRFSIDFFQPINFVFLFNISYIIHSSQLMYLAQCEFCFAAVGHFQLTAVILCILVWLGKFCKKFKKIHCGSPKLFIRFRVNRRQWQHLVLVQLQHQLQHRVQRQLRLQLQHQPHLQHQLQCLRCCQYHLQCHHC